MKKTYGSGFLDFPLGNTGRADAMKRLLSSAATEGGEEFLESMGQTALQRITYDPDAQWDFSDALYQAGVGAALGAATADPFLIGFEEGRILSNAELAEMENGLDTKSNSNYVTDAFHSLCTLVQNQRNAYTEYKTYSSVLGELAPSSLREFQNAKEDPEVWDDLQHKFEILDM